ncbi:cytochrome P450 [Usnea florida]
MYRNLPITLERYSGPNILLGSRAIPHCHLYVDDCSFRYLFGRAGALAAGPFLLIVVYFPANLISSLYFHPLRKYPGPRFLAASRIPYPKSMYSDTLVPQFKKLHGHYGQVVRTDPGELSYISADTLKTIYGHYAHSRVRRTLLPPCSDMALLEQQAILENITEHLISNLRVRVKTSGFEPVDLFEWYIWTTFDLIGEISFGEPFDCLKLARFIELIRFVLNVFKTFAIVNIRTKTFTLNCDEVDRRIASKSDHPDFLAHVIKSKKGVAMPIQELYPNSKLIVLAGSESTASGLAGVTFNLLMSPEALKKAIGEIRGAFTSEQEVEAETVKRQPYLAAIVRTVCECIRPFSRGFLALHHGKEPRSAANGFPEATHVAHRSTLNLKDPDVFAPERRLGDNEFATDSKEASQPFSVGTPFDMQFAPEYQDWDNQESWIQWDKETSAGQVAPAWEESVDS